MSSPSETRMRTLRPCLWPEPLGAEIDGVVEGGGQVAVKLGEAAVDLR